MEKKFIIEFVLLVITLAIVLWYLYSNYSSITGALRDWINDFVGSI